MTSKTARPSALSRDHEMLSALEKRVLWLATWTIHHANFIRPRADGLKIGGHQASSASLVTLMTALYFSVLRPRDRVAVKPHASPVFHAIQYLLGNQTREALENFRDFGGAQSYPSRTKDTDDVDFSTGSVGLGPAMTLFASLTQDYLAAKGKIDDRDLGRMVALVGDAEFDEGNMFEALLEGWKHDLRNCWWIVDYNRQSLDAVIREDFYNRIADIFTSVGWRIVTLKYGHLLQEAFREPGGKALEEWIDTCPNGLYSALVFQGGGAWRARLEADFGRRSKPAAIVARRSDADLARLMTNLGGHDLPTILDAFRAASKGKHAARPTCFIAYTIKGFGLPLAGHKDNHAGLMNESQIDSLREQCGVAPGEEWEPLNGLGPSKQKARLFLDNVAFNKQGRRRHQAALVPTPDALGPPAKRVVSTQAGLGQILDQLARDDGPTAAHIVTTSPDVASSTNLGAWVNRRALFARAAVDDVFKTEKVLSAQKWAMGPEGQHIELGIAENNFFLMLAALGLSHSLFGQRLIPIGTLYDPFIQRGLDALNYACYQDARFILVGTPSGITLGPEGGAHQSVGTPLIGMAQDGLAAFEPGYADELAVILAWALDYVQRDGSEDGSQNWLRDGTGGSVYLRLSTRALEQPRREIDADLAGNIVDGAYWVRPPGPNCQLVIAYAGAVAPEAFSAAGLAAEFARDIGVLAVTSADRLNAGWHAAERSRRRGVPNARAHIETLLAKLPNHAAIVTVLDGHPTTLSWLGGVYGHRVKALGVEHFGQTGSIPDLYRHYGLDAEAILGACRSACQTLRLAS